MNNAAEIKSLESVLNKLKNKYDKTPSKYLMDVITDLTLTLRRLKEIV